MDSLDDYIEQRRLHPLFLERCHPGGRDVDQRFRDNFTARGTEGLTGDPRPEIRLLEAVPHAIEFVRGEIVGIGVLGAGENISVTRISHPKDYNCIIAIPMTQALLDVLEPVLEQGKDS